MHSRAIPLADPVPPPQVSPTSSLKPTTTTASSAGRVRSSRGLFQTSMISKETGRQVADSAAGRGPPVCLSLGLQFDSRQWRKRRTIRAASGSSISVSGRDGGRSSPAPPSKRSIIGNRIASSISSKRQSSKSSCRASRQAAPGRQAEAGRHAAQSSCRASRHSERSEESCQNDDAGQILRCAQNDGLAQNDGVLLDPAI